MLSTNPEDYKRFRHPYKQVANCVITVVADSGAQSCLWSRQQSVACGFSKDDLIPVHHDMKSANQSPISIDGAVIVRLSGVTAESKGVEAAVMVYISPDARSFYLSMEAMIQLRMIHSTFPQVGVAVEKRHGVNALVLATEGSKAVCG